MSKILIVDDDAAVRTSLSLLLRQAGYDVLCAQDPAEALQHFKSNSPDLVVMDMNFSLATTGDEGLQLLGDIKRTSPDVPVVLITAWGSITLAVEGMKRGAADFITKPWNNDRFLQSISTALSLSRKATKVGSKDLNRRKLDELYDFRNVIGEDPELLSVMETIGRVARTNAPILIVGESGTGKELIAEAIHRNSPRNNNPFVKVNLGGIPRSLFESEMFGHRKGAFTDAKHDRTGRFELAHTGTIFLDEIGELDLNSQVKLLRVIQDGSFEILGSSKTNTVDVRVVSATNRSLESMVENEEFREDLFYRINLITVKLPPLRERRNDIPLLLQHLIDNMRSIYPHREVNISSNALHWLEDFSWPGNIRELKNLVERTILITDKSTLEVEDFEAQIDVRPRKGIKESLPEVGSLTLEEIEKMMIIKALNFHEQNVSRVAKSLGISRGALYRKMEKYGLDK
jgi:DNA-binding NtrC family response regulator